MPFPKSLSAVLRRSFVGRDERLQKRAVRFPPRYAQPRGKNRHRRRRSAPGPSGALLPPATAAMGAGDQREDGEENRKADARAGSAQLAGAAHAQVDVVDLVTGV